MTAWNDQPYAMQQGLARQDIATPNPGQQGGFSTYSAQNHGAAGGLVNPLLAQAGGAGAPLPGGVPSNVPSMPPAPVAGPSSAQQLGVPGTVPLPLTGQVPQPQGGMVPMAAPQAMSDDDDRVPADDLTWINHTRRAIAETQGDPHRQVQLIQHIRSQYLKQRFGRTVRTDEA